MGVPFNSSDYITVVIFVIVSLFIPCLVGYIKRRDGFLKRIVAGRKLGFVSVALTMFLSENGTAQLTGMAGWAVHSGLGIYGYELVGSIGLLTLGWVFMPVYKASGVYTTIDYINKRFGGERIGFMMAMLMISINTLAKLSVELQITHVMLSELYKTSQHSINIVLLICSFVVITPGGLHSIVFTNNVQFIFFIVGIPVLFIFPYRHFFSWQEIQMRYQRAWPNTTIEHVRVRDHSKYTHCGMPDIHSLDLIRTHNDKDLPWPGMIFGIYIISVYNFCIDQSILQFCVGARDIVNTKYACVINAFFKVFTIFLVIPGFMARVLYTDQVACAEPEICQAACNKRSGCADLALPMLFRDIVPEGWHGVTLVAFVTATLTSLSATLHAGSTVFIQDLYRPFRETTSELECAVVSKVVELLQAGLGMALVWSLTKIPALHDFIRQIYSTLVPPLVAVYTVGIFWDCVTEDIAFKALVFGSILAVIRLTSKMSYGFVPCGEENEIHIPDIISNFHDLHFAVFLFVLCFCYIAICAVKLEPIDEVYLYRLLFWNRFNEYKRKDINLLSKTKGLSSLLSCLKASRKKKTNYEDGSKGSSTSDDIVNYPTNCLPFSKNTIIENELANEQKAIKSVKESTRETQSLNAILILLLLIIAFVMGFFK